MAKKDRKCPIKIVGHISDDIAKKFSLMEYLEQEIVQSTQLDVHTNKHAENFFSIDSYHNTLMNIDKVIEKPYYVEYDNKRKSLKYYGKIDQYVCVIVKIKNKKEIFISTFYPQSREKIDRLREKMQRDNFIEV